MGGSTNESKQLSPSEMLKAQKPLSTSATTPTTAWRGTKDTPATREAVKQIVEAGEKYGVSLVGASLRWLSYHSQLESRDAIVLGAANWRELGDRVGEIAKGPLPEGLVAVLEEVEDTLGFGRIHT